MIIVTVPPLAVVTVALPATGAVAFTAVISNVSPKNSASLSVTWALMLACGPVWFVALPTSSTVLPTALYVSFMARGDTLGSPNCVIRLRISASVTFSASVVALLLVICTVVVTMSPGSITPSPSLSVVSTSDWNADSVSATTLATLMGRVSGPSLSGPPLPLWPRSLVFTVSVSAPSKLRLPR